MVACYLSNIEYTLGETRRHYREAPSFEDVTRRYAMPDLPELFGWGHFHETKRSLTDLIVETAQRTLDASGLAPDQIDVLLVCSTNMRTAHEPFYPELLQRLGLSRAFPIGIAWGDCAMLMSALETACSLLKTGRRTVLIVAANRIEQESYRFQRYALFSDGAVSCLATAERCEGYEVLGSHAMSQSQVVQGDAEPDDSTLYRACHDHLMQGMGMRIGDIERVLASNVFLPVLAIKEGRIGAARAQLYLDNVVRIGHCFCADPLVNLRDLDASGVGRDGGVLMLTANASGLRGQMVLRRVRS
ncbi:hypothetical protein [Chromobacterium sp. IIBBL 290-4]|uniref:hypothetical protein n=1 Tax=Chromobacterium sp. IIBBL 290-4 TaxID=2953890 RepID=UPI0020B66B40|nr:hypothetical protein [Chromobacterium sp. IIBBL 290-4]UTH76432.1 hypothetical protein NKT35_10140 [Chromobacterium sp. IIBBL 290-4]